jgi:hypothetical protein
MYLSLRAWAKRFIKADSTPNLIKNVAERLSGYYSAFHSR